MSGRYKPGWGREIHSHELPFPTGLPLRSDSHSEFDSSDSTFTESGFPVASTSFPPPRIIIAFGRSILLAISTLIIILCSAPLLALRCFVLIVRLPIAALFAVTHLVSSCTLAALVFFCRTVRVCLLVLILGLQTIYTCLYKWASWLDTHPALIQWAFYWLVGLVANQIRQYVWQRWVAIRV
jgi:hypothetical protein